MRTRNRQSVLRMSISIRLAYMLILRNFTHLIQSFNTEIYRFNTVTSVILPYIGKFPIERVTDIKTSGMYVLLFIMYLFCASES